MKFLISSSFLYPAWMNDNISEGSFEKVISVYIWLVFSFTGKTPILSFCPDWKNTKASVPWNVATKSGCLEAGSAVWHFLGKWRITKLKAEKKAAHLDWQGVKAYSSIKYIKLAWSKQTKISSLAPISHESILWMQKRLHLTPDHVFANFFE